MNNKRNISFTPIATVLTIAVWVVVSCSGLIAVAGELITSDDDVAAEMNSKSTSPNIDLYLLDSSVKEAIARVGDHNFQMPVNSSNTITSENTAISIAINCPDRKISKTVFLPEPTILPQPILKLVPSLAEGKDFHEIEFSLYFTFNKLNEIYGVGLEFDFSGSAKNVSNTSKIVIV